MQNIETEEEKKTRDIKYIDKWDNVSTINLSSFEPSP